MGEADGAQSKYLTTKTMETNMKTCRWIRYKTTRAQRVAIYQLFCRTEQSEIMVANRVWAHKTPNTRAYRDFRKTVMNDTLNDCLMVAWCGMFVGIEKDGYTHT